MVEANENKGVVARAVEAVRGYFHPANHVEEKREPEWYAQREQAIETAKVLANFVTSRESAEINKRLYAEYQRQYQILSAIAPSDSLGIARAQAAIQQLKFTMELPQRLVDEGKKAQEELNEEAEERARRSGVRQMKEDEYAAV